MAERNDRDAWRGYAALAFVIVVIAVFIQRFVLVPLLVLRLGTAAFGAIVEAVAIVGIGGAARVLFAKLSSSPPERESVAADFLVGYPLFGTLAFLIGAIRISQVTMMVPIVCGFAALVLRRRIGHLEPPATLWLRASSEGAGGRGIPRALVKDPGLIGIQSPMSLHFWPAAAVIITVFGCGLLAVQTPPSTLDELAYHLTIPKTWISEGRAIDLPLLSHSYFPLGIESADLPFFSLLPDDAGYASHLLHFFAAIAALLVFLRFLGRRVSSSTALIGTAAMVSVPALAVTAGWSLVEWPLIGLCILLAESLAPPESSQQSELSSCGAVLAAGLLTKYTFWPIGTAAIVAILVCDRPTRRSVTTVLSALVIGTVFPLRNLILAGNPVAPFLSAHSPNVSGYRDSGSIGATFAGYLFDGRFVDEALGITLVVLAFVFAVTNDWQERSRRNLFAGGTLLLCAALCLTTPSARILVPYLAVAALFGAVAVDRFDPGARRSMLVALTIAALLQSFVVVYFTSTTDPLPLLTGRMSDEQYLARSRRSYPAIRWTDARLPDGSQTLIIGLHELYEFDHRVRGSGNFDGERMSAYLSAGSADALAARLRSDHFTHLALFATSLVPQMATASKMDERLTRLSPQAATTLQSLLARSATPVARSGLAAIYKLR